MRKRMCMYDKKTLKKKLSSKNKVYFVVVGSGWVLITPTTAVPPSRKKEKNVLTQTKQSLCCVVAPRVHILLYIYGDNVVGPEEPRAWRNDPPPPIVHLYIIICIQR